MDLTVIIVNWNTREMLKGCLESLQQDIDAQHIHVIVVDNDSKDGSRDMIQQLFPKITLINSGGNVGFARANNLAMPVANTPYIVFLNPDTIVMKDTLLKMVEFMHSSPKVGGLSCKITYGPDQKETIGTDDGAHTLGLQWFPNPLTEFIQLLFLTDRTIQIFKRYLPYKDPNRSDFVNKLYGTCLMVRREVLEQVGYFDERFFMYGEDVDLCRRITMSGWKLYYMSDVKIAHIAGGASKNTYNEFSILMKCESISRLMDKYYGTIGNITYKIVIFGGSVVRYGIILITKLASGARSVDKGINLKKYGAMIKWSLNLVRPHIPD